MLTYGFGRFDSETGFYGKIGEISLHSNGVILSGLSNPNLTYWKKDYGDLLFYSEQKNVTYRFSSETHPITGRYYHGVSEPSKESVALWPLLNRKRTFKILVASHKDYFLKTDIQENLYKAGVPSDAIRVVIAGSDNDEEHNGFMYTKKNFWEYAALLRAVDAINPPDYWFLIHDTTLIGPKFYNKLMDFDFTYPFDVVSLNRQNQFNIGFYKHSFLKKVAPYIASLEGMSKEEGISVEIEARIRNQSKFTSCFNINDISAYKKVKVWGENLRSEFYLQEVDLYKYLYYIGKEGKFHAKHVETP